MTAISETITLLVEDANCNPVYLRWKNSLGGWDYYLFEIRQYEDLKTDSSDLYQTNVTDLSTATEYLNVIKKEGRKIVKCGTETIKEYEFDLIKEIIYSPKVQLFTGTAGDTSTYNDWQTIILNNIKATKDTFAKSFKVELELRYIEQYTISN